MKFKFYALQLTAICVLIFILQITLPWLTNLLLLNALAFKEIWRFVTSIFLHGNLAHLLYNAFALALFGSILESLIGGKKFLTIFFLTGILANLIAVNFYNSSLGASGAIFGIIGALVVIRPMLLIWAFGLPMPIFIAGILWAFLDFIGLFTPSNVGNIAHLAGMFFGLLLGLLFRRKSTSNSNNKGNRIIFNEDKIRSWEDSHL
ncbi:rhomboid family intramembrane serine protease [Candidatus Pacearchaeota archaeon]|nr:rhomboid family intramembrane serine protease [Candidatus Pacearchaeota archaeon]